MEENGKGNKEPFVVDVVCPFCGKHFSAAAQPGPPGEPPKAKAVFEEKLISDQEAAFREKVVEKILKKEFEIPLLPDVALRVIRLTGDANTSMQDLAKVILTDQGIAGKILQIANSPVYGGAVEIKTNSPALVRRGPPEVKDHKLALSMQSKIFKSASYRKIAKSLWEHAIATALAARVIANALRMEKEEAFVGGLMHDLGKMILLHILDQSERELRFSYKPAEETVFLLMEQYHSDLGPLVVEAWDLPGPAASAVRDVPRIDTLEEIPPMIAAVSLASDICDVKGIGYEQIEKDLPSSTAAKALSLTPETCEDLVSRFNEFYEQAKGAFQ